MDVESKQTLDEAIDRLLAGINTAIARLEALVERIDGTTVNAVLTLGKEAPKT